MVAGRRFGVRVQLAAIAAAFSSLAAGSAQAQVVPKTLTPLLVDADINDVNIADGKTQITGPVLSVPAAPNLRFDRVQNVAPFLVLNKNNSSPVLSEAVSIHYGSDSSVSFKCLGHECTEVSGTGSYLTTPGNFTLAPSGAKFIFDKISLSTTTEQRRYASSIRYTDGEIISITYETGKLSPTHPITFYRPAKASSNRGYYIQISYLTNGSAVVAGWDTVAVASLYSDSDTVNPLGRLTYSGNNITDIAGRIYQCTGCNQSSGQTIPVTSGQVTLPGETTPQKVVSAGAGVINSVTRDGVTYSYSYQNLRIVGGSSMAYDGLTVSGPEGYNETYKLDLTGESFSYQNVFREKTDSIGRVWKFQRDNFQRITEMTEPEGNIIFLTYTNGMISSKTLAPKPGSGLAPLTESLNYDLCTVSTPLCWRPTWYRDQKGNQTDYLYDNSGLLIEQTDPADASGVRRKTYIEYETSPGGIKRRKLVRVCGQGTTCGANAEIRTEYEYFGNTDLPTVVREIDLATGQTLETRSTYDVAGRLLSVDKPRSDVNDISYYRYDILGRKTWEISPPSADGTRLAKRYTYRDSDDQMIAIESGSIPNETSTALTVFDRSDLTYDSRRNVIQQILSAGGQQQTASSSSYDLLGRLECTAQRMNPAIYGSLPANACSLGAEGSFGSDRITRNVYDAAGQLLKVQKAYGTALQEDYATYTYSSNGKPASLTDAEGNPTVYQYDGFDRLLATYYPTANRTGVNWADYEAYGYDANGNRTSLRKRDGSTITYQYDALNRNTVKIVPERSGLAATHTRDVYYGYDLRGLQTYARFDSASGEGIATTYDGFGRQILSTLTMDGATRTLAFFLDKNGNRTRADLVGGYSFTYTHDGLSRLTGLHMETGPSIQLVGWSYNSRGLKASQGTYYNVVSNFGYDAAGRLNSLSHGANNPPIDVNFAYGYTPASQLSSQTRDNDGYAWTAHYNVDRSYTANGLNQYTAAGAATFAYDANGNLTSDGSTTYVYDVENRLVSASGVKNAALRYDPLGRLYETIGGSATTRFLYDGDELVAEFGGSGNFLRQYAHGTGNDDPVYQLDYTVCCSSFLHADHQGSIIAITGDSVNTTNSYDEYGIPKPGNIGRFQYTGQAWLPEIGMYYYKARIYSPTLGRFMQTDPVGYEDQTNLYAYVGNDPLNRMDPNGTQTVPIMPTVEQNRQIANEIARDPVGALINVATAAAVVVDVLDGPVPDIGAAAIAARAARLERRASGASSAVAKVKLQKQLASEGGLKQILAGEAEVIAGAGHKRAFDGAEAYAKRYGGNPSAYTKVSSEARITDDGMSISVHAVRNTKTGKVYDPKTIIEEFSKASRK